MGLLNFNFFLVRLFGKSYDKVIWFHLIDNDHVNKNNLREIKQKKKNKIFSTLKS
jgi:hypothetical protein